MLVDDHEPLVRSLARSAEGYNLSTIGFTSGVEALHYLEQTRPLPRCYLIDMKLADVRDENKAELEAPQAIYYYVKEHGDTTYFRFLTGHMSEHDEEVQKETGATVLLKRYVNRAFFEELAASKTGPE